jgi:hypothetical protein
VECILKEIDHAQKLGGGAGAMGFYHTAAILKNLLSFPP